MTDEWGEPGQGMGDRINPRDIVNHLLIVWVIDYIAHSPTRFTVPGKPSDVIVVDIVDLDQADDRGYQGLLARKVWWRQSRLISMLKEKQGSRMLARMVQGTGSTGFNAPFELISMLSDPACKARADQWLKAHPDFVPSVGGQREMLADLAAHEAMAKNTVVPEIVKEKTYLEQLAEQASRGGQRIGTSSSIPPPPPIPDTPGY